MIVVPKASVRASSLIEVVIAMTVIIVVFGIALMIFSNISRTSLSVKEVKAHSMLRELMANVQQSRFPANRSIDTADFHIEQEVATFPGDTSLIVIHLTVFDRNQEKITEMKKVITK